MKQTQKLITLVLLALALNAAGKTVEAKSLPVTKPGAEEPTKNNAPKKEPWTVTAISFSGLQSLSEQELTTSLPLKPRTASQLIKNFSQRHKRSS